MARDAATPRRRHRTEMATMATGIVEAVAKRRWHEALGVGPETSAADVRRAFHRLARKWHPDRCREVRAKEIFQALQHAFEKVSRPANQTNLDQVFVQHAARQNKIDQVLRCDRAMMIDVQFVASRCFKAPQLRMTCL